MRRPTLVFCGDDDSCMLTLTVSGHAGERRVIAVDPGFTPYPEDDRPVPPSFRLHLQLLPCQFMFFDKVTLKESQRTRIHAPTSVVNGEDCTFPPDTLPILEGILVEKKMKYVQ